MEEFIKSRKRNMIRNILFGSFVFGFPILYAIGHPNSTWPVKAGVSVLGFSLIILLIILPCRMMWKNILGNAIKRIEFNNRYLIIINGHDKQIELKSIKKIKSIKHHLLKKQVLEIFTSYQYKPFYVLEKYVDNEIKEALNRFIKIESNK